MVIVTAVGRSRSQRAVLEEAQALGEAFDEEVQVVHVLSQSDFLELERTAMNESGKPVGMDRIRDVAKEIAREEAAEVDGTFVPVGLIGDVTRELVDYTDEHDVRYLVIGGRRRSPTGKALFGSNTQSILLNATVPVVTVTQPKSESK